MVSPEALELVEDLAFLRCEPHGAQLGQGGERLLLACRMRSLVPLGENDDLGRTFREVVREPDLDPMVFPYGYL
jgi:hypothetical protein